MTRIGEVLRIPKEAGKIVSISHSSNTLYIATEYLILTYANNRLNVILEAETEALPNTPPPQVF